MKHQIQIIALVMAAVFSSTAFSEGKKAVRIDFNKMIDENNMVKNELQKEVAAPASEKQVVAKKDDKNKVIDFIDVEIGVGQTPTVVDRRFDSVSDAQVVDLKTLGL
ncbi:MAG: hypothetical protein KF799_11700 [Bdellovibrionales bacterium]|nr:hypothetical protein [Bdellovibrionales bacterium]